MATDIRANQAGERLDRITVRRYLAMIVNGELPPEARVELLDGRLVEQMTKFAPHNYTARQLGILIKQILPEDWLISEEKSLNLGRYWGPEPDLAIIRGPNSRYRKVDPTSKEVSILIEVADSSYTTDRREKWRAYASARIPIYWFINLEKSQIEVYTDPAGRGKKADYRQAANFDIKTEVPVVIESREMWRIKVKEILP